MNRLDADNRILGKYVVQNEYWTAAPNMRWFKPLPMTLTDGVTSVTIVPSTPVLQQMWISSRGAKEWRDVEVFEEPPPPPPERIEPCP